MRPLVWHTGLRTGRREVAGVEKNDEKTVDLSTSFGSRPTRNYNDPVCLMVERFAPYSTILSFVDNENLLMR